jgi:hypothetical protein
MDPGYGVFSPFPDFFKRGQGMTSSFSVCIVSLLKPGTMVFHTAVFISEHARNPSSEEREENRRYNY